MNKSNAICVFVKNPVAGQVKTRMQPEVSPENARRIYQSMTEDLLDGLHQDHNTDIVIFFWPPESENEIREWLGQEYSLVPQIGDDLGKRMSGAFDWAREHGFAKAIVIGSDIPDLDTQVVYDAFRRLDKVDVVLGPSSDGGYYLIGMKQPHPELFEGVSWGGPNVYQETTTIIRHRGLSIAVLDELDDMDTFLDLERFWQSGNASSQKRVYAIINKVIKDLRRGEQ